MDFSNVSSVLEYIFRLSNIGVSHSERSNNWLFRKRKDDNIFVPAAACYILNSLTSHLPNNEVKRVEYIIENTKLRYNLYKNQKGRLSYNFWRTNHPNSHFPNGRFLNKLIFFRLPDDVDTTAMILLSGGYSIKDVAQLKAILPYHANGTRLRVNNSLPQFSALKCYSTWFGEKMPIELDCCVLANLMLLLFESELPLNEHDTDVIAFLSDIVLNDLYTSHPFQIAPEYPRKAIILYHLSRLISKFPHHFKMAVVSKLTADIKLAFDSTVPSFDKMLLQTSLLRFNACLNANTIHVSDSEIDDYWWFTAGFLSSFSNPLMKMLAPVSLFHYRFKSRLLNVTLILENRILLGQYQKEKM